MKALNLFLQADHQDEKDHQVPHSFVEEGRMHLDVIGSRLHVGGNALADIRCAHHGDRQTHGEQVVRIFAEDLSVKEVAPAAQNLSEDKAEAYRIKKQEWICLFLFAENENCDDGQDDTAIDRKAASPQIENLNGVILIIIPHEYHVIDAGTRYCGNHDPDEGIPVQIRILPRLFCNLRCDGDAHQHSRCDQDSVERNPEIADHDRLGNIAQIDSQVGKGNVHISHHLFHKSSSYPDARQGLPGVCEDTELSGFSSLLLFLYIKTE